MLRFIAVLLALHQRGVAHDMIRRQISQEGRVHDAAGVVGHAPVRHDERLPPELRQVFGELDGALHARAAPRREEVSKKEKGAVQGGVST